MKDLMVSTDNMIEGSDIKALVRDELQTLDQRVNQALNRSNDRITTVNLRDVLTRIDEILDRL